MDQEQHARLLNAEGELIAEDPCRLDEAAGLAMLEPEREPGVIQKERGVFSLALESGRTLHVSDKPIIFRIRPPTQAGGPYHRRTLYRLRLVDSTDRAEIGPAEPAIATYAQEATAAGAGEGTPAAPQRQTPAAR